MTLPARLKDTGHTTFGLTAKANRILDFWSAELGVSRTAVLELVMREYHRHHKDELEDDELDEDESSGWKRLETAVLKNKPGRILTR